MFISVYRKSQDLVTDAYATDPAPHYPVFRQEVISWIQGALLPPPFPPPLRLHMPNVLACRTVERERIPSRDPWTILSLPFIKPYFSYQIKYSLAIWTLSGNYYDYYYYRLVLLWLLLFSLGNERNDHLTLYSLFLVWVYGGLIKAWWNVKRLNFLR